MSNMDLIYWNNNCLMIDMEGRGGYAHPALTSPIVHWACQGYDDPPDADLSSLPVVSCTGCASTVTLDSDHAEEVAAEHKARAWKRGELEPCLVCGSPETIHPDNWGTYDGAHCVACARSKAGFDD